MRMIQCALDPEAPQKEGWVAGHGQMEGAAVELSEEMRQQVIGTVWFDPWQYQFENAPALSLVRAIVQTSERRKWIAPESRALNFFRGLGIAIAEGATRAFTAGQAGLSDVLSSIIKSLGTDVIEKSFSEVFQEQYSNAVEEAVGKQTGGRLVVFLDDLDRCQPEYVVRMLEALKLTLLNPHCVYVLGVDDGVVGSAVHHHYRHERSEAGPPDGSEFSGQRYLEKIIQLPIRLPGMMPELAEQFVDRLIPDGALLARIKQHDPNAWRKINTTLLLGLRANPRQAKRFVMLMEFTLLLARAKAEQAKKSEQQLPVDTIDLPLLVKLQLLQFSWPEVPRDAAKLRQLERRCTLQLGAKDGRAPAETAGIEEDEASTALARGPLRELLERWDIKRTTQQEELVRFLLKTSPRFEEVKEDKVLDFHIHLAAATAEAKPRVPTEEPSEPAIRSKPFTAKCKETKQGIEIVLNDKVKMDLVKIKPGEFQMGSGDSDDMAERDEKPRHRVRITKPFFMDIVPVTQEAWDVVMEENRSFFTREAAKRPVERVTWFDAREFCRALSRATGRNVRLPTEAEWEYACRANTKTRYWFGEDPSNLGEHAWFGKNSGGETHAVGAEGHANPWGLSDMHGNVWEWCQDVWHESYEGAPSDESAWTVGGNQDLRVLRGGAWYSSAGDCRSACRSGNPPDGRGSGVGFRVVVSAGMD